MEEEKEGFIGFKIKIDRLKVRKMGSSIPTKGEKNESEMTTGNGKDNEIETLKVSLRTTFQWNFLFNFASK